MKIIRDHEDALSPFQVFRVGLFYRHELINCIKDLFLDSGPCIQLILRDHLIYLFVHAFCAAVPVSHRVSQDLVIFIQQHIVNAPCIDAHRNRNLPDLFTFLKTVFDLCKETVHIPAERAVLIVHSVRETVHLFKLHLAVLHAGEHVASAGRANINGFLCKKRTLFTKNSVLICTLLSILGFFFAFFTNLIPAFCTICPCIPSDSLRTFL